MITPESYFIVPLPAHNSLVSTAFVQRGYDDSEASNITQLCADAARHGIRTHNAIKALHLDDLFGSRIGGCRPHARVEVKPSRFPAAQIWNANQKIGPSVAYQAIETCIQLADQFGVGIVSVDNAWHYLWGGGYVLEAARRGYIGYTNCTAMLAEVVPFGGKFPTLGTNPHSWAFPTTDAIGFPILVDWATSAVAMGRVQQLKREGKSLPPGSALDADGLETSDPAQVKALLPFGRHKGYGLGLIDELVAAFIGASIPTVRGRFADDGEKHTPSFFLQVIHPDAISGGSYAKGQSRTENIRAVLQDIISHGNDEALYPGEIEARHAAIAAKFGGLLFTSAELDAFNEVALQCGMQKWNQGDFKCVNETEIRVNVRK